MRIGKNVLITDWVGALDAQRNSYGPGALVEPVSTSGGLAAMADGLLDSQDSGCGLWNRWQSASRSLRMQVETTSLAEVPKLSSALN